MVSKETTNTLVKNKERIKSRARLRESQNIALKVLYKLDELGWSQKELANKMNVSPQQISKIVSGKENLTLESIVKIQQILEIPILTTYKKSIQPVKFEGSTKIILFNKIDVTNTLKSNLYKSLCTPKNDYDIYQKTA